MQYQDVYSSSRETRAERRSAGRRIVASRHWIAFTQRSAWPKKTDYRPPDRREDVLADDERNRSNTNHAVDYDHHDPPLRKADRSPCRPHCSRGILRTLECQIQGEFFAYRAMLDPSPPRTPNEDAGARSSRRTLRGAVVQTGVTAAICSFAMVSLAPITASTSFRVWHQLPSVFLVPRPGDVGWTTYWMLCLVWAMAIGVVAAGIETMALSVTRRILPTTPVHWILHAVLAMGALFVGASCHSGLPR